MRTDPEPLDLSDVLKSGNDVWGAESFQHRRIFNDRPRNNCTANSSFPYGPDFWSKKKVGPLKKDPLSLQGSPCSRVPDMLVHFYGNENMTVYTCRKRDALSSGTTRLYEIPEQDSRPQAMP